MPDPLRRSPSRRPRRNGATARPLVMVTAYDDPGARIVSTPPGSTSSWSGDSVANTVLGYDDTLHVDIDVMAHHTAAVARAAPRRPDRRRHALDELPPRRRTTPCATRPRSSGPAPRPSSSRAGAAGLPWSRRSSEAEIPVMGHLGLTPQSVHAMGGFRVQGKSDDAAGALLEAAKALAAAGCFALRARGGARRGGGGRHRAARRADHRHRGRSGLRRPGPGLPRPARPGQARPRPKFVRRYADARPHRPPRPSPPSPPTCAVGGFPGDAETYHGPAGLEATPVVPPEPTVARMAASYRPCP